MQIDEFDVIGATGSAGRQTFATESEAVEYQRAHGGQMRSRRSSRNVPGEYVVLAGDDTVIARCDQAGEAQRAQRAHPGSRVVIRAK